MHHPLHIFSPPCRIQGRANACMSQLRQRGEEIKASLKRKYLEEEGGEGGQENAGPA
jgi:hypothetical protein